jgi:hypothetical protein
MAPYLEIFGIGWCCRFQKSWRRIQIVPFPQCENGFGSIFLFRLDLVTVGSDFDLMGEVGSERLSEIDWKDSVDVAWCCVRYYRHYHSCPDSRRSRHIASQNVGLVLALIGDIVAPEIFVDLDIAALGDQYWNAETAVIS